jgi:hypothetical protein
MPSTASDRFGLASSQAFTERVQQLGQAQARTILEQCLTNGEGALISGVTFNAASGIAIRFIADQGFWAGKMALDIVNDGAIEARWTGSAFAGILDTDIRGVLPYTFALFRNVS